MSEKRLGFCVDPYSLVCWTLGGIFLIAGGSKAILLRRGLVPDESLFSKPFFLAFVVLSELLFAVWLLCFASCFSGMTRCFGICIFGLLATVSARELAMGRNCYCFGQAYVSPAIPLTIDLIAMPLLWLTPSREVTPGRGALRFRLVVSTALVTIVAVPLSLIAAYAAPSEISELGNMVDNSRLLILRPSKWKNKRLPLVRFINLENDLTAGNWLVVLHSSHCAYCQTLIPEIVQMFQSSVQRSDGGVRLALIDVVRNRPPEETTWIVQGSFSNRWNWFVQPPVVLDVKNGVVVDVCTEQSQILRFAKQRLTA